MLPAAVTYKQAVEYIVLCDNGLRLFISQREAFRYMLFQMPVEVLHLLKCCLLYTSDAADE